MRFFDVDLSYLLKITMFGKTLLTSTEHHLTRYIHGIIIYIVADGSITLEQDGQPVRLGRGDVYVFEDGEYQVPIDCNECTYYYLHFEQEHVLSLNIDNDDFKSRVFARRKSFANADIYSTTPYDSTHAIIPKQLHIDDPALFERLILPIKDHRLNYEYNTPSHRIELSAISARLLMELEEITYKAKDSSYNGKSGTVYETASAILRYVEKNYAENFSAEDIESIFYLNYDYANRIFKRHFGQSIISHRNRLRINTAKALLLKKSVDEVALLVGFSNPYYFSRCFKKHEGISPTEYREKMRSAKNEI